VERYGSQSLKGPAKITGRDASHEQQLFVDFPENVWLNGRHAVANRKQKRLRTGRSGHDDGSAAAEDVTRVREQAAPDRGELGTGTLTEKSNKPQITLRNGAVVDARQAVTIVEQLQVTLEADPEEFKTLLALAEGRTQDADPRHFEELWAQAFLNNDHSIKPIVRDVLLNCHQITPEGPVVVPLRLKDAADLPAAQRAQRESDQFLRDILHRRKSSDERSPD
jgi:hypothetical protein